MSNDQQTKSINLFGGQPMPRRVSLETLALATAILNQVAIPDGVMITQDVPTNTMTLSWPHSPGLTAMVTVKVVPTKP